MARLNFHKTHRLAMAAILGMETYSRRQVDKNLYELIKLRASLVNQCHYCIDMHTKALRNQSESERRIRDLETWSGSDAFDARERAALDLTDAVTELGDTGVPDQVWDAAAEHFSEKELGDLVVAIATINVWNRVGIAFRLEEG